MNSEFHGFTVSRGVARSTNMARARITSIVHRSQHSSKSDRELVEPIGPPIIDLHNTHLNRADISFHAAAAHTHATEMHTCAVYAQSATLLSLCCIFNLIRMHCDTQCDPHVAMGVRLRAFKLLQCTFNPHDGMRDGAVFHSPRCRREMRT